MVLSAPAGVDVQGASVNFIVDTGSFSSNDIVTKNVLAQTEENVKTNVQNIDALSSKLVASVTNFDKVTPLSFLFLPTYLFGPLRNRC